MDNLLFLMVILQVKTLRNIFLYFEMQPEEEIGSGKMDSKAILPYTPGNS